MKQQENIKVLFEKYLNGMCTEQEIRLLFAHFERVEDEALLRELVQSAMEDDQYSQPFVSDRLDALTGRVEARLVKTIRPRKRSIAARLLSRPALAVAATVLVLLCVGSLLYLQRAGAERVVAAEEDVSPGGNLATLTLAGGRVIQLSTEQNGIVVGDGITYLDGSWVNDGKPEGGDGHPDLDRMALTTPRGGTYQLTLADGTKVWLNAASTLRYPARFADDERVVELEGEAYFEVSHRRSTIGDGQKIPFRVVSRGQTVEVLGTQFNVAAYSDGEAVLTTLVKGAVQVISDGQSAGKQRPVTLRPGEQSAVKDGRAVVNPVDVSTFAAWKDGLFSFKETEMRPAMKQLARWYNVDIVYEGQIPETYFFGDIRRDKSLSHVLAVLKKSGVHFNIEKQGDRHRIVVLP